MMAIRSWLLYAAILGTTSLCKASAKCLNIWKGYAKTNTSMRGGYRLQRSLKGTALQYKSIRKVASTPGRLGLAHSCPLIRSHRSSISAEERTVCLHFVHKHIVIAEEEKCSPNGCPRVWNKEQSKMAVYRRFPSHELGAPVETYETA